MLFKDASELHKFSVESGDPDLFDRVVGAAVNRAIEDLERQNDLFDRKGDAIQGGFDQIKKSLPTFTVGELKEQVTASRSDEWFCPLFIKEGEIALLGGESKRSGKTTFTLHMLKAIHDGTPFMEMPTKQANSVVLTEQGNNILEALGKAGIQDTDGIHLTPFGMVAKKKWPELIKRAVYTCEEKDARILVIDTFSAFARLRGSDENISGEILERMEPIIEAARVNGIHVSLLHHTGKNGEIRGSSAFSQEADVIWLLKRPPGDHAPNVRQLEGLGRYDEVNTSFNLALERDGYKMLGTNNQIQYSKARTALLREIPEGKPNAVRRTGVIEKLTGEGHSKTTLAEVLIDLTDKGEVLEEDLKGRGNPKILWRRPKQVKIAPKEGDDFDRNPQGIDRGFDQIKKEGPQGTLTPVEDHDELSSLIGDLSGADAVAIDLETFPPEGWIWEVVSLYRKWRKGLKHQPKRKRMRAVWEEKKEKVYKEYATNPETAQVRLVSIATHEGLNRLIDAEKVDPTPLLDHLQDKILLAHNASFNLGVLRERYGYVHRGKVVDTQHLYTLLHYADAGRRDVIKDGKWRLPDPFITRVDLYGTGKVSMNSLAAVAKKYLRADLDKDQQTADWSVPDLPEAQLRYALEDTKILLPLSKRLIEKLEDIGMGEIVDLENRALAAQIDMELNGFPADAKVAEEMAAKYLEESREALKRVEDLLPQKESPDGDPWNWNKDEDIRDVLRLLGAKIDSKDYPKTEKTGQPATGRDALSTIKSPKRAARWAGAYLEYLNIHKRYRDFASKYCELIRDDGVIRGRFATVSTGRLNCQKPNLQQVPKRGELQSLEGMRIRDVFRAPPGEIFVIADFAQVELLLAATIAQRKTGMKGHMLEVFEQGETDIHTETAASMMGKSTGAVTSDERLLAKAVNFGLIYGAKAETLLNYAKNSYGIEDMTLKEAHKYREAFFERYPELQEWHRAVEKECREGLEYSTTPLGRRRKLPKWDKSNAVADTAAKNSPVQGARADAMKGTLARLFEDLSGCPGNPRLRVSVHDEVVLTVAEEHAEKAVAWVKEHMAEAEREAVGDPDNPIVVDVKSAYSWGDG